MRSPSTSMRGRNSPTQRWIVVDTGGDRLTNRRNRHLRVDIERYFTFSDPGRRSRIPGIEGARQATLKNRLTGVPFCCRCHRRPRKCSRRDRASTSFGASQRAAKMQCSTPRHCGTERDTEELALR